MHIKILGAESLGVRGLACLVEVEDRKIVIDPGVALGYLRHGLLPHPAQIAVGERVRCRILSALQDATDVVLSHYHGDHVPLPKANPYQLAAQQAAPRCQTVRFWAKGPTGLSDNMLHRRERLEQIFGRTLPEAEDRSDGLLTCSKPVPHGRPHTGLGTVMMTRIEDAESVFVHASDIQLFDDKAVSMILDWKPKVVLVGGPPLYLERIPKKQRAVAWENAKRLIHQIDTVILDHHLLRCVDGLDWLDRLSTLTHHQVVCAADYLERSRCLLEARREELYQAMPVPKGWHKAYAQAKVDTEQYRELAKRCL